MDIRQGLESSNPKPMAPEYWQQAKQIFHTTLERAPDERSAFLAEACGGDELLRQEVESLISAHEKEGSFIDSPAYEAAADLLANDKVELKPGQVVGSYEVSALISRGGMGEVYLAQDKRLGRRVALKLLPSLVTKDAERLRRFEQEARAVSALNHPNILTIYEIHEANSTLIIATEYVEGETLRARLSHKTLDLETALHIAIQIADALAAAHKAGIIHRDIKTENIMIRPDGYVKVLDFGLAKLVEAESPVVGSEAPSEGVKTSPGTIMGTVGYMSPEQVRGQSVDARSDIFNLGVVIYEMTTGQRPFAGETSSDVLAAILTSDPPPLSHFIPEAPPELVRIVTKALRKDRELRYQVIQDMLLDMKSLKEELDFQAKLDRSVAPNKSSQAPSANSKAEPITGKKSASTTEVKTALSTNSHSLSTEISRHKTGAMLAAAALAVAVIAGIFGLYKVFNRSRKAPETSEQHQEVRTTQLTFSRGLDQFPSLSPDGNSVAYSSDQNGSFEIYLKQLTPGGRDVQLTTDGQQNLQPAWSPDGQRIAYFSMSRGGIWIVPALGGNPKQLVEFGSSPTWSLDGLTIIFQSNAGRDVGEARAMAPSTIWSISSAGGKPRQITRQGNPIGGHSSPALSPDGKRIAFQTSDYGPTSVWQISVDGSDLRKIADAGGDPIYAPNGREIYVTRGRSDSGLSIIRLSPAAGEQLSEPEPIVSTGAGSRMRNPSISADGKKIVYTVSRTSSTLWSISLSDKSIGAPKPFSLDTSLRNTTPRFSHDGRKVALVRYRVGAGTDIWLADADGKNETQLTTDSAEDNWPNWFPHDDRIAFLSNRQGKRALWAISLATGKEEQLLELDDSAAYPALSPDGTQVAFNSNKSGTINMWIASLSGGGEPKQLTFSEKDRTGFPTWSPDGQSLAFLAQHGEDGHIMVMPTEGGSHRQFTFEGENYAHSWSPDGGKLAFVAERDGIWNVYWISLSTREQKQLTNYTKLNAFVRYCDWSPLGNQIVYEHAETTGNIWLVELK